MRVKKVHMVCSVKGCKNRDTFYISEGGDFVNTPNICKSCLEKALEQINALEKPVKVAKEPVKTTKA